MALSQLQDDILSPKFSHRLVEAVESLLRRNLINQVKPKELNKTSSLFKLDFLLEEYTTTKLIKQVSKEIMTKEIKFLKSHALIKAQSKHY